MKLSNSKKAIKKSLGFATLGLISSLGYAPWLVPALRRQWILTAVGLISTIVAITTFLLYPLGGGQESSSHTLHVPWEKGAIFDFGIIHLAFFLGLVISMGSAFSKDFRAPQRTGLSNDVAPRWVQKIGLVAGPLLLLPGLGIFLQGRYIAGLGFCVAGLGLFMGYSYIGMNIFSYTSAGVIFVILYVVLGFFHFLYWKNGQ